MQGGIGKGLSGAETRPSNVVSMPWKYLKFYVLFLDDEDDLT